MSTMNHYLVLGINEDADRETIRSAFRSQVRRYHPDAGAGSSPLKFRRAVEAYETLIDPERRLVYDRTLQRRRTPPSPWTVEPLLGSTAEPLVPGRHTTSGRFRTNEFAHRQPVLDDLFIELLLCFEPAFWSAAAKRSHRR